MNKFKNNSRVLTWFRALLLSALAAGCGGGGGGQDPILGAGGATTAGAIAVAAALANPAATAAIAAATAAAAAAGLPPPVGCLAGALDLGRAANFAVLAESALSITNPTTVTGDVGSPSITPAAGPSTLVGTMFDSSPATELTVIADAVADMRVAVACANARTCDVNLGPTEHANTAVTPGVRCYTGSINIAANGVLTLNGAGVYIFRISGGPATLDTEANTSVAFAGGATVANTSVFWVPVGVTTLGSTSAFKGTIMSSAAAVNLGDVASLLNGRALAGAAVNLNNNVITRPTP